MTKFFRASLAARAVILTAASLAPFAQLQTMASSASLPAQGGSQGSGFLGAWCAQGDPTKHASISGNGAFFNLTNENGDTSTGHLQGFQQNVLVADGWQFVQGTLSSDGGQINWSNGTFWARCNNGGGGGGRRPNIDGTWYRGGDRSKACYVRRRGNNLRLTNESGAAGSGSFDSKRHVTTNWSGTTIGGTISSGGDRINWDNGTYWTR